MDNKGRTPVFIATERGNPNVLRFLLEECGADPTLPNNDGMSPVMAAAAEDEGECLKLLLEKKHDINLQVRIEVIEHISYASWLPFYIRT